MTPIVVFQKGRVLKSLRGAGLLLGAGLLCLWLAHEASGHYAWQMAIVTIISALAVAGLLFRLIYLARNALLRKPMLWTDGVSLVYMTPYESRVPLADIAGYRFNRGRDQTAQHLRGVTLFLNGGKRRYIPLGMAETTTPLVGFMRAVTNRQA